MVRGITNDTKTRNKLKEFLYRNKHFYTKYSGKSLPKFEDLSEKEIVIWLHDFEFQQWLRNPIYQNKVLNTILEVNNKYFLLIFILVMIVGFNIKSLLVFVCWTVLMVINVGLFNFYRDEYKTYIPFIGWR